jgi:hypothetical protein
MPFTFRDLGSGCRCVCECKTKKMWKIGDVHQIIISKFVTPATTLNRTTELKNCHVRGRVRQIGSSALLPEAVDIFLGVLVSPQAFAESVDC